MNSEVQRLVLISWDRERKLDQSGQEGQNSSYKIHKFWRCTYVMHITVIMVNIVINILLYIWNLLSELIFKVLTTHKMWICELVKVLTNIIMEIISQYRYSLYTALYYASWCMFFTNWWLVANVNWSSINTTFLIALAHFQSLCHNSVILAIFQTFSSITSKHFHHFSVLEANLLNPGGILAYKCIKSLCCAY